jgi:hypothetical protein
MNKMMPDSSGVLRFSYLFQSSILRGLSVSVVALHADVAGTSEVFSDAQGQPCA